MSFEPLEFAVEGTAVVRDKRVDCPVTKPPISMMMSRFHVVLGGIGFTSVKTIVPYRPPLVLVLFPGLITAVEFAARVPLHVGVVDPPEYWTVKTDPG